MHADIFCRYVQLVKQTFSAFVDGPDNTRKWHISRRCPFSLRRTCTNYSIRPSPIQMLTTRMTEKIASNLSTMSLSLQAW